MNFKVFFGSLMVSALSVAATPIITNYGFEGLTNNNNINVATGEKSLNVAVESLEDGISFTFTNNDVSAITDIYFAEDPVTLEYLGLSSVGAVKFSEGANPSNLPSWNGMKILAAYSFDSDSPVSKNGISKDESLTLNFSYLNGANYGSVIDALNTGALKVGVHVQAFAVKGGSESFQTTSVPEPTSISFMVMGFVSLFGFGFASRRSKK